jgi:hypothetical protein
MKSKITLTDYPQLKTIEANYRGVETEKLINWHKHLRLFMMTFGGEQACGYNIVYDFQAVRRELNFRNVPEKDLE